MRSLLWNPTANCQPKKKSSKKTIRKAKLFVFLIRHALFAQNFKQNWQIAKDSTVGYVQ